MLDKSYKFLYLASGVKNSKGFWFIGVKNSDENILDDKFLLDCHRKELIGQESAKDILYAINLNLNNLNNEFTKNNYLIDKPPMGISFNIPLDLLENIFDFWFDTYKDKESWETCLGLLKIKRRISLLNLIKGESLKGNSKKWAIKIEKLHSIEFNEVKNRIEYKPMWD